MSDKDLRQLIEQALSEDLGGGDVTTDATITADAAASAEILAKQDLVLSGIDVAREVFLHLDPSVTFDALTKDGDTCKAGTVLARVSGKARVLLAGERVALNLLQHLSGIATLTAKYVVRVRGTRTQVMDTRKTLPGLRKLEKFAVRMGGGKNHRMGLYDMVLIKDNHIKAAGGITAALGRVRTRMQNGPPIEIEVETRTLDEVKEALSAKADIIMLDNMPIDMMRDAVVLISGRAVIEASGNVSLENIRDIARTGVDRISVGAITHSAPAVDISMKII